MIDLVLTSGDCPEGVHLRLPSTPGEIAEAFCLLEAFGAAAKTAGKIKILHVVCPVKNLGKYIQTADVNDDAVLSRLNQLAGRIGKMDARSRLMFSGALDTAHIAGLDDILKLTEHLNEYVALPNIDTDTDLGRFLVDTGYKDFPEEVHPYLDYAAIGSEYRAKNGGVYVPGGFVRRKSSLEHQSKNHPALITLHLFTQRIAETTTEPFRLELPATDEELEQAKAQLGVDHFTEAAIVKVEFGKPYLAELIPQDCICVEDANELALGIEEMMQRDGEFLTFLAVLAIEKPETMTGALHYAMELDDYERITEGTYEYGQSVLRRHGADDELLEALEGYANFEKLGEDSMVEDGVRQTEFGLIRRISTPFPVHGFEIEMA